MPANTTIFLLGLAFGTGLLVVGIVLGYWFGRKSALDVVDRQQFLNFLRNLSSWTTEFSGDVTKYQSQLLAISQELRSSDSGTGKGDEIQNLLAQIMEANQHLQQRLDNAEHKLELQTGQISNYLTEARTDGLTGLFNRRALDKATDELFADWQKRSQSFALGLIDIDHFKHINDTYGHPAGDAVLRHIAGVLQTELHDALCIARYGGEEFAVLSTATVDEVAADLDHLRDVVSKIEVQHEDQIISVSLSAGAAEIRPDDKVGNLVRRADEALYASKLGGRNRVHLHDGAVCHLVTKLPQVDRQSDKPPDLSPAQAAEAETVQSRLQERLQRIVEEESKRVVEK